MGIIEWIRTRLRSKKETNRVEAKEIPLTQYGSIRGLWYHGTESEWKKALNGYYHMLGIEQRPIEAYFEHIDADAVGKLNVEDFYDFLHDKYFVWKYTAKNRLATTRKNLEKYVNNDELSNLGDIQARLFAASKKDVSSCLRIASEIKGLGTAGASGLLAVLFPEDFGTVDQFVAKRLMEIEHPIYHTALSNMNPEVLKLKEGVILIEIMKEKAKELNQKFNTDFWTPRKIDMVLWSFGR